MTREIVGGGRLVGTEDGRSEILRPRLFPLRHAESGGIVDDVPGTDSHASDDAHVAIHAGHAAIDVAQFAVKFLENGDIGFLSDRQSAKFGAVDFLSGVYGGAFDEIVERHAHSSKLGDDVGETKDGEISRVQIGRHGIGDETLLDRGHRIAEPETSRAVSDIENNTAVARFAEDGVQLAVREKDGKLLCEDVGVNVAGAGFLENQVGVGAIGTRPEIVHHRPTGGLRAGDGVIDCGPRSVLAIPRRIRPVVRRFHSHDKVRIFFDGVSAAFDVHLVDALLQAATHAVGNDVEESEHPDLGMVDDAFLFLEESFGTGSTRVNDGSNAGLQGKIGGNAEWRFVEARFRIKPVQRGSANSDVVVDVDEARSDVETGNIDYFSGRCRGNVFVDGCDSSAGDGNIHRSIDVIRGIDDMATSQEEIIAGRWSLGIGAREQGQKRK